MASQTEPEYYLSVFGAENIKAERPVERRRGRPPLNEPGSSVSAWVPVAYHDKLIALARQERTSVSSLVRRLLVMQLGRRA